VIVFASILIIHVRIGEKFFVRLIIFAGENRAFSAIFSFGFSSEKFADYDPLN
jgi:hypothetical protein